jgi:glycine betaine transporter
MFRGFAGCLAGVTTPRNSHSRSVLIPWGVLTGITAVGLMLAGGLSALQNTVIVASPPFLVIIAGLAISFWKQRTANRRVAVVYVSFDGHTHSGIRRGRR